MKKFIIGLVVGILLFSVFTVGNSRTTDDPVDQQQTVDNYGAYVSNWADWAQSFVPTMEILTKVELKVRRIGHISSDLVVSIRRDLDGDNLTTISKSPGEIPATATWIEFDFDDIAISPGQLYFIVCSTSDGDTANYYDWRNSYDEDTYPKGDAWYYPKGYYWYKWEPYFDFCFKTYGRENNAPVKPSKPDGPSFGFAGITYNYKTASYDVDGDKIRYGWDWNGDGSVDEWTIYYDGGTEISTPHTWSSPGVYMVRVKARDEFGKESEWSDPANVVMPYINPVWQILVQILLSFMNG